MRHRLFPIAFGFLAAIAQFSRGAPPPMAIGSGNTGSAVGGPVSGSTPAWSTNGSALFADPVDTTVVGIGTDTPSQKLDVHGSVNVTGTVFTDFVDAHSPLQLQTGGVTRVFIGDAPGFVGIGTVAPLARLHVTMEPLALTAASIHDDDLIVEAVDARLGLYSLQSGIGGSAISMGELAPGGAFVNTWGLIRETTPGGAGLRFTFGTNVDIGANPTNVYFDDGGNVGIGNIAPATRLHISGGTDVSLAGGGFLQMGESNGFNMALDNNEIEARNNGGAANLFLNNDGGNVIIGAGGGGNVAIGNINPVFPLEILDTQAVIRMFTSNHTNGAVLELWNLTPGPPPTYLGAVNFYNNAGVPVGQIGYLGDNSLTFRISAVEKARFDANGNFGIGTTTPGQKLDVTGNVNVTGTVFTDFVSSHSPLALQTGGVTRVLIDDPSGNVGINTLTPAQKLHVVGNGLFTGSVLTTMVDSDVTPGPDDLALKTDGTTHLLIHSPSGKVDIGNPPVDTDPSVALEVNGCIKATCFKVTTDTVEPVSPLRIVKAAGGAYDLVPAINGVMTMRPTGVGVAYALIPLDFPAHILGNNQTVKSIEICYKVTSTNSTISAVHLRSTKCDGTYDLNIADPSVTLATPLNSRVFVPYMWTPAPPLGAFPGPMFLVLDLNYGGTGTAHDISISRITLTVAEAPGGP